MVLKIMVGSFETNSTMLAALLKPGETANFVDTSEGRRHIISAVCRFDDLAGEIYSFEESEVDHDESGKVVISEDLYSSRNPEYTVAKDFEYVRNVEVSSGHIRRVLFRHYGLNNR